MTNRILVVLLTSILTLAAILVTEPIYNISLFDWSITAIPKIQAQKSSLGFTLWELYSTFGLVLACAAPIAIALYYTTSQRTRAVYYTVVLAAIFLVMNITKLAYHQARPFWVSSAIEAGSCSSQFGNPSGHSLTSLGIALAVWLDYNQSVVDGKISSDSQFAQIWARALGLLLALTFGVSIGWSRFVLGAHSMNQIIFGLLLAVWLAASFHYGLYHYFMDSSSKLVAGSSF